MSKRTKRDNIESSGKLSILDLSSCSSAMEQQDQQRSIMKQRDKL
jgi:hypothetical protein